MKLILANFKGEEFEVQLDFSEVFKGRGGWDICCQVTYSKEDRVFKRYITDSMFIDEISDMKGEDNSYENIQLKYKDKVFDSMEEVVIEWCEEIYEQKNGLKSVVKKANSELKANIFSFKDESTIWNNTDDRVEGNDIDMTEDDGVFTLTMTGITEDYSTVDEAVDGLIDMYGE